jgi:hypothetical protein
VVFVGLETLGLVLVLLKLLVDVVEGAVNCSFELVFTTGLSPTSFDKVDEFLGGGANLAEREPVTEDCEERAVILPPRDREEREDILFASHSGIDGILLGLGGITFFPTADGAGLLGGKATLGNPLAG